MTDITANVVVSMPSQLFTMARSFKAVANGKIYIGKIDTDPVNPENQIQVYVENEDGSHVPVSQPIIINAAGYPVYNGQIAKFVTVQGHSMAVYDAYGAQQFYFPNVLKYDPDQLRQELLSSDDGLGDSLITVKQPLINSTKRTQHDKNAENISILDFVKHEDVSDIVNGNIDATHIFSYASSVSPDGVYVPQGTYLIDGYINGKFYGPGKIIQSKGDEPIPFANPAQTIGNVFLGFDAGKLYNGNDISGQVVAIGPSAGRNISTGNNITAIGTGVLSGDTLQDDLTDTSPCTGTEIVAIGVNACKKATTASNIIGIGRDALNENKEGNFNVAVGSSALQQLHTGSGNVAIGRAAGMRAGIVTDQSGKRLSYNILNNNTFIGNASGREITNGDNNTYIGSGSGRGISSIDNPYTGTSTGMNNVAVGADSLNSIGSASNNVMLGYRSGRSLSSGTGNIFIGNNAGSAISSGDNQLIIANQSGLPFLSGLMGPVSDENNYARFDASVQPATDNARNCGSASRRWNTIFAGTSTINTSDGRVKTDKRPITDAERRVAYKIKGLVCCFRFIDSVIEKGENARLHFGIIAQDVYKAFAEEGLDANDYGLFCYDKWETEYEPVIAKKIIFDEESGDEKLIEYDTGERRISIEGGERYGIRYEELLCFIISAI
ncbi:tail fiber domain-containing protein [Escherichia coli]|nr:tail fiber domain-containing protein [Escherichia coli]